MVYGYCWLCMSNLRAPCVSQILAITIPSLCSAARANQFGPGGTNCSWWSFNPPPKTSPKDCKLPFWLCDIKNTFSSSRVPPYQLAVQGLLKVFHSLVCSDVHNPHPSTINRCSPSIPTANQTGIPWNFCAQVRHVLANNWNCIVQKFTSIVWDSITLNKMICYCIKPTSAIVPGFTAFISSKYGFIKLYSASSFPYTRSFANFEAL